jgi:putative DNA modification/repair radical SAM protein
MAFAASMEESEGTEGTMTVSMTLSEKLAVLASAAKYDVSCSSSGSSRKNAGGTGNAGPAGICHSWTEDGRCVSLLKVLLSNECVYDCAYCVNRSSNDVPRSHFTPEEMAELTMQFYKRNYIEGLFLSSAVHRTPDYTMEMMLRTVTLLRREHRFSGYIHAKVIPGASLELASRLGALADRVSVNIELPSEESLRFLAPQKSKHSVLAPMSHLSESIREAAASGKGASRSLFFAPAGQSTQLIVGATGESDFRILRLSEGLYRRYFLKRVYYSAYVPVSDDRRLPALAAPPLLREHRLYQADWLLRFYGFHPEELLDETNPQLDAAVDPKVAWALRNLHLFPLEVNTAPYEMLLRVPGIGVTSAKRILTARKVRRLEEEHLRRLGVVLKRGRFFLLCNGRALAQPVGDPVRLRNLLCDRTKERTALRNEMRRRQLLLFSPAEMPV